MGAFGPPSHLDGGRAGDSCLGNCSLASVRGKCRERAPERMHRCRDLVSGASPSTQVRSGIDTPRWVRLRRD